MPGIAGIVDFNTDPTLMDQNIRQMANILTHTSPSAHEICVLNDAGLCAVRLDNYLYHDLIAQDENVALAFWGYLWDHDDLKRRAGLDFVNISDLSAGQLLLSLYDKEGIDGLCNLNGRFVIAIWNNAAKVLNIVGDRHGFCKLFYWVHSRRILFASEYKAIIWHKGFTNKIDHQGLADFMALGFSTGDRTFFRDVRLLPPACVATFKNDAHFSIRKYWDYSFHSEDDPVFPEEHYLDKFAETLVTVTNRQLIPGNHICLPLSAGLDSRTLAGILDKIGYEGEVKTLSYGNPHCYDVVYGQKIARKARYDHSYVPIESTYLKDHAENFVWLTEGTVNCLNAHMLLTYPFIQSNGLHSVVTGFFGDTISGSGSYLQGIEGETRDDVLLKIQYDLLADIMRDGDLAIYMRQDLYKSVEGKTFKAMQENYYQCPSKNRYFRTRYLNIHERQRRYTAFNLYIFESVANVISPFLDHDFVDFVLHIPPVLMIGRNLYIKTLIKHFPEVASAPYNKTKLPLNASWIRQGFHWRWEQLIRNPLIRATIGRGYAKLNDNYLKTHEAIRTGSRDFVEKSIRSNEFLGEFFNMERVNELLDNHMTSKVNEPTKITALLTFALWGRMFVENHKPSFE